MASEPVENPWVGWAIGSFPEQQRSTSAKKWFSLRNLLIFVLLAWNGYFLAALIYELTVQSPSRSTVIAVILWLWVLGDAAILLCSWALGAILRSRRRAA